jgi:hypothetical protein
MKDTVNDRATVKTLSGDDILRKLVEQWLDQKGITAKIVIKKVQT